MLFSTPVLLMGYKMNLQYSSHEVHYFTALFKMKWKKKEKDQCLATCIEGITELLVCYLNL